MRKAAALGMRSIHSGSWTPFHRESENVRDHSGLGSTFRTCELLAQQTLRRAALLSFREYPSICSLTTNYMKPSISQAGKLFLI